ncbi:MAG: Alkylphosphonate utilization operon protein PhnA [uncultured Sulfurovum sp.]|uniref:Alkylphosphonate utilization operon protein PhnA n=1 Tax=uncultured Sulfurovum sp. TaxID=269237 RepID=A0A6S6U3J2_9BACT|nr:MAG: Alkylphosphonate utilization operon protein PhnA [uncultured Sulfurovum sp.]
MSIDKILWNRAGHKCELCGSEEGLSAYVVEPKEEAIVLCEICLASIDKPLENESHWFCLNESMWSEVPAVQVMAYRVYSKLGNQEQLDMMYMEEEVKAWAKEGLEEEGQEATRDANGTILVAGDSVSIIKDLVVKGAGFTAKQGTTVKNIRMVPGDPTHIQGKVNGSTIFIISAFLKKL